MASVKRGPTVKTSVATLRRRGAQDDLYATYGLECGCRRTPERKGGRVGMGIVTLFRPVGPAELELIKASGWKAFPPRLPDQPIFYPVTNHAYATQIARDYSAVPASPLAELAADLKVV